MKDAGALSYYASADGIGVLGPRGWSCEGDSGSSGFVLFLTPHKSDLTDRIQKHFEGPAIEIYHIDSEASGTWEVAEFEARIFPAFRASARRFYDGMGMPFPHGSYPRDTLTYINNKIVEYRTPAQTEGLGTHYSWLKPNGTPVSGAVILLSHGPNVVSNGPDVIIVFVRILSELAELTPVIIRDVEREAVAPRK
jgi:hypothetical protein